MAHLYIAQRRSALARQSGGVWLQLAAKRDNAANNTGISSKLVAASWPRGKSASG